MQEKMQLNIKLMNLIKALKSFVLVIAIIVPFFNANGLGQTEIYILQSLFAVGILLLEIPSGYFADTYGRKTSIQAGFVLILLGFLIYSLSGSFWPMIAAELILGFGYSFLSGADEALAYDSFKALGKEGDYKKFASRSHSIMGVSEAVSSVLGGLMAVISLRAPFVAQVAVGLAGLVLAFRLTEPPFTKSADLGNPFKEALKITKYALNDHQEVKWVILFAACLSNLTHTAVWLIQPYFKEAGAPLGWFGVLWALPLLAMAWFSRHAISYENWLGRKRALVSLVFIGVATYCLMAFLPYLWALPVILGFYFVRGVQIPVFNHYLNGLIESRMRATVLSVKSLVASLSYAALGPFVGWVFDAYSLQAALFFAAGFYGLTVMVVILNMHRLKIL